MSTMDEEFLVDEFDEFDEFGASPKLVIYFDRSWYPPIDQESIGVHITS